MGFEQASLLVFTATTTGKGGTSSLPRNTSHKGGPSCSLSDPQWTTDVLRTIDEQLCRTRCWLFGLFFGELDSWRLVLVPGTRWTPRLSRSEGTTCQTTTICSTVFASPH